MMIEKWIYRAREHLLLMLFPLVLCSTIAVVAWVVPASPWWLVAAVVLFAMPQFAGPFYVITDSYWEFVIEEDAIRWGRCGGSQKSVKLVDIVNIKFDSRREDRTLKLRTRVGKNGKERAMALPQFIFNTREKIEELLVACEKRGIALDCDVTPSDPRYTTR